MKLTYRVNGRTVEADGVWPGASLLTVLRDHMGMPGSKNACEQGECGSCSVYLDGVLVCSCLVAAGQAEGRDVVTVEGLAIGEDELHPIQEAFLAEQDAVDDGVAARFGELVADAASPIDDVRGSAAYRRHALGVLARRTLTWAWKERG